jgi:PilZ domain
MNSPQRHERRDFRFPLHLPVLVKIAQRKEMQTQSENISLSGMLLSSSFLIPEGSTVEVSVGADHQSDTGILLSARGKVIRVHAKDSGDFSVAIKLDMGFSIPQVRTELPQSLALSSLPKKPPSPITPIRQPISRGGMHPGLAWHTET